MPGIKEIDILRALHAELWTNTKKDKPLLTWDQFKTAVFSQGVIATRETARAKWLALGTSLYTHARSVDRQYYEMDLARIRETLDDDRKKELYHDADGSAYVIQEGHQ